MHRSNGPAAFWGILLPVIFALPVAILAWNVDRSATWLVLSGGLAFGLIFYLSFRDT